VKNGFVCELLAEDIAERVLIGLEMGKVMRWNFMNYEDKILSRFVYS